MESDLSSGNGLAIKAEILKYHMYFEVCLQLVHRTQGVRTLQRFFCLFLKWADAENSASFPSPNSEMLRNTLKSLPVYRLTKRRKSLQRSCIIETALPETYWRTCDYKFLYFKTNLQGTPFLGSFILRQGKL